MKLLFLRDFKLDSFAVGIDEALVVIQTIEDCENTAAYKIVFYPIAGDYTKFVNNVIIVNGRWEGLLGYTAYQRAKYKEQLDNDYFETHKLRLERIKEALDHEITN